jgi:hypothetical protein
MHLILSGVVRWSSGSSSSVAPPPPPSPNSRSSWRVISVDVMGLEPPVIPVAVDGLLIYTPRLATNGKTVYSCGDVRWFVWIASAFVDGSAIVNMRNRPAIGREERFLLNLRIYRGWSVISGEIVDSVVMPSLHVPSVSSGRVLNFIFCPCPCLVTPSHVR